MRLCNNVIIQTTPCLPNGVVAVNNCSALNSFAPERTGWVFFFLLHCISEWKSAYLLHLPVSLDSHTRTRLFQTVQPSHDYVWSNNTLNDLWGYTAPVGMQDWYLLEESLGFLFISLFFFGTGWTKTKNLRAWHAIVEAFASILHSHKVILNNKLYFLCQKYV